MGLRPPPSKTAPQLANSAPTVWRYFQPMTHARRFGDHWRARGRCCNLRSATTVKPPSVRRRTPIRLDSRCDCAASMSRLRCTWPSMASITCAMPWLQQPVVVRLACLPRRSLRGLSAFVRSLGDWSDILARVRSRSLMTATTRTPTRCVPRSICWLICVNAELPRESFWFWAIWVKSGPMGQSFMPRLVHGPASRGWTLSSPPGR